MIVLIKTFRVGGQKCSLYGKFYPTSRSHLARPRPASIYEPKVDLSITESARASPTHMNRTLVFNIHEMLYLNDIVFKSKIVPFSDLIVFST